MDSLLLQAVQGIHQLGEGSLQLEQGNHPPVVDNPLLLVDNRLLGVGIRLPVGGSLLLQAGNHLLLVGSHLLQEGSHLLLVGSHLLGEDMPLVEAGNLPPVVGILQTEEGILGSSSSEPVGEIKLETITVYIFVFYVKLFQEFVFLSKECLLNGLVKSHIEQKQNKHFPQDNRKFFKCLSPLSLTSIPVM